MQKTIYVESLDSDVIISRRKGTRSIRISIKNDGVVKLSVPYGITEGRALRFLDEKREWIAKHKKPTIKLTNHSHVGKSWRLIIQADNIDRVRTRLKTNEIVITHPLELSETDHEVQVAAKSACERALKKEAENLLPQRLEFLANQKGIKYKSVKIKKLKSRWGSCDNFNNIVLNIYLTQLDWKLIDYVILHELAHTLHPHHQSDFWDFMEELMPDYKVHRKELKTKPTEIHPS